MDQDARFQHRLPGFAGSFVGNVQAEGRARDTALSILRHRVDAIGSRFGCVKVAGAAPSVPVVNEEVIDAIGPFACCHLCSRTEKSVHGISARVSSRGPAAWISGGQSAANFLKFSM